MITSSNISQLFYFLCTDDQWSWHTVLVIRRSKLRQRGFTPGILLWSTILQMSKSKQRTVVVMFFFRKAFERLGFRVASEFLYTEYKVMLVFNVQGVYLARCISWSYCTCKVLIMAILHLKNTAILLLRYKVYILAILQVEEECVFEKIKNHRGTAFMIKELSQNQPVRYSRRLKQH